MQKKRLSEHCAPAIVVLLLSPVMLIFALLLALGSGFDIFEYGELPLALALCVPTLVVLLRYLAAPSQPAPAKPPTEIARGHIRIPDLP
ncbi:MAG TPA: hypothetical protein VME41_14475 [Stellaceae bacterium]|nr:hypothetical protein [Stellaceae bacterium]